MRRQRTGIKAGLHPSLPRSACFRVNFRKTRTLIVAGQPSRATERAEGGTRRWASCAPSLTQLPGGLAAEGRVADVTNTNIGVRLRGAYHHRAGGEVSVIFLQHECLQAFDAPAPPFLEHMPLRNVSASDKTVFMID